MEPKPLPSICRSWMTPEIRKLQEMHPRPNPMESWEQLFINVDAWLGIGGLAYLVHIPHPQGEGGIYLAAPYLMRPRPPSPGYPNGSYVFRPSFYPAGDMTFPAERVIKLTSQLAHPLPFEWNWVGNVNPELEVDVPSIVEAE